MAKSIMIQGTMSDVGKSIITAGLCRIFKQDGFKAAPFKSQNMALNSFITEDRLEIGRAQAVQAEAAGIKPKVSMNSILIKPSSETESQIIVNGEVVGNMTAREYFEYKKKLAPIVMKSYKELEAEYDIVVIEGAGSPAEINLKSEDIVNMDMAQMAKAPVLLVGDIDRGGVFAQIVGTLELLEEDEKQFVKGLIINKFRGDKSILDSGVSMLEERAGIPVVGVVPYMDMDIEEEDSLSHNAKGRKADLIDIAVISVPHISLVSDFNALKCLKGVTLRYIKSVSELGNPDMIILPGTKNTMHDLMWLRQTGMEAAIMQSQKQGKVIFGICGGFQMLGKALKDPYHIEEGGEIAGMGIFPMETVFHREKTRTKVAGKFGKLGGILSGLSGAELEGYEIHMGVSKLEEGFKRLTTLQLLDENECKLDGAFSENVYGSYVHGIFDRREVTEKLIQSLAKAKGIDAEEISFVDYKAYKESQYDLLAETLRKHLNMKKIYEILEKGI